MIKKYFNKCLVVFLVCFVIISMPCRESIGSNIIGSNIFIESEVVQAAEKVTVIVVKKVTNKNVRKINEALNKGKALDIKVKGNKKQSLKLINKINAKLKKENKQGVIFTYNEVVAGKKYTTYKIDQNNAENYKYAVKLIKKLYDTVKAGLSDGLELYQSYLDAEEADKENYPDDIIRFKRQLFDTLIKKYREPLFINNGWECKTKVRTEYIVDYCSEAVGLLDLMVKFDPLEVMTFEEFQANPEIDKVVREDLMPMNGLYIRKDLKDGCYEIEKYNGFDQKKIIYNSENFCDLSDAMKVFVIDESGYFSGETDYGVKYNLNDSGKSRSQGIKNLYNNEGSGVCSDFTDYEIMLWNALDFENYSASAWWINHAWSVVKVENSKGKELWIPFDYGIGPSEYLMVSEEDRIKYLKTEEMRYKLYLEGVEGAPKYKNFTEEDFN